MFHLLGFLLIIFLAILIIGLSIIGTILRTIFGFGRRRTAPNKTHRSYRNVNQSEREQPHREREEGGPIDLMGGQKREKFFSESDGEYTDFEEIKE